MSNKFFDIYENIKIRPEMYFGESTLTRFRAYIDGWMHGSNDQELISFISSFNLWIKEKYKINSDHSWDAVIRFYAKNDCDAFKTATNLIDEFRKKSI